jgi:hypothetical protein
MCIALAVRVVATDSENLTAQKPAGDTVWHRQTEVDEYSQTWPSRVASQATQIVVGVATLKSVRHRIVIVFPRDQQLTPRGTRCVVWLQSIARDTANRTTKRQRHNVDAH